jgi:hypothetical protein
LQRRLAQEGCSFQRLIDETRQKLMRNYLHMSTISITHVGYAGVSIFSRAFNRGLVYPCWNGAAVGLASAAVAVSGLEERAAMNVFLRTCGPIFSVQLITFKGVTATVNT